MNARGSCLLIERLFPLFELNERGNKHFGVAAYIACRVLTSVYVLHVLEVSHRTYMVPVFAQPMQLRVDMKQAN